jgi:hypothetical protein
MRRALAFGVREHDLPLGAEHDLLERVGEVAHPDELVLAARGEESGLVRQIGEVGPDHPWGRGGETVEIDVRAERHRARVHGEDELPSEAVGRLDGDAAVEAARPQQCGVEHVGAVGGANDDHAGRRIEAVHLSEDLVQRLLALVVAAAEPSDAGRARAADRVELIDENDRRRRSFRLGEQVADA